MTIGIGCMRLSTERDRGDERSIAVLHAAFDAGADLLDTADAYCRDQDEAGHNERLIARALATWGGDRSRIRVATKGGLVRPGGAWVPDGRAVHLARACEASRVALGVDRISLYQLHAPDPRTPLATSVRALAALKRDGLVEAIGLCNVNVGQIERARELVEIAAVQVELSPWNDDSVRAGVVGYCLANGIRVLAYRPLGGAQRHARALADPVLSGIAVARGVTSCEVALAWLRGLSPLIVPIPGPTRVETAASVARAAAITLTAEELALLDERFPAGRLLRSGHLGVRGSTAAPRHLRPPAGRGDGEVVLIMGLPGAGKSTLAASFVEKSYARLNRDEAGGSLAALLPALDRLLSGGTARVVLDNTYVTRKARASVLEVAGRHGLPARCVWLSTSLEDAQLNTVGRMVSRYGRLLGPEEMSAASRQDPGVFGPTAQFRQLRALEPPEVAEGFTSVEVVPFERAADPASSGRAILLWCDGVLRRSRSGRRAPASVDDVEVFPERAGVLRRYRDDGFRLLAIGWQPEVAEGSLTAAEADAGFERMRELLGVDIEVAYCPHGGGPPVCWCRKPLPGLGAVFIHRHRLDPSRCVYVGAGPQDPGFARRLGFQYREAGQLFGG